MSKRKMPNDHLLVKLYQEGKSAGGICLLYNMSSGSRGGILKVLKKYNIDIRKEAGKSHHNWKGGRIIKGDGYYGIWNPSHERADKQGYVYEHTLILEKNSKIPQKGEVIHHIDLDKLNNNIENLYLCGNKEHLVCHRSIEKLIKPLMEKGIIFFEKGIYKIK